VSNVHISRLEPFQFRYCTRPLVHTMPLYISEVVASFIYLSAKGLSSNNRTHLNSNSVLT